MKNKNIADANFSISKNDHNEQRAWIYNIGVYPEYQKQKIGSEIIHAIIDIARAEQCSSIRLYSVNDSRHFYETLGFIADKQTFFAALFSDSNCFMEKKL